MQELNKEDTLANLYAIRAGLSIISEIADREQEFRNEIWKAEYNLSSKERELNALPDMKQQEYNNYFITLSNTQSALEAFDIDIERQKLVDEQREEIKEIKENILNCRKSQLECLFTDFLFVLLVGLIALIAVGYTVFGMFYVGVTKGWLIGFSISGVIAIVCAGLLVWITSIEKDEIHSEKEKLKQKRKELIVRIGNLPIEQEKRKDNLQKLLAAKEEYFTETDRKYLEESERITNLIQDEKSIIATAELRLKKEQENFLMVYNSMQEQFATILDERDWRNLDLIIFNYETGRAKDLRDALIQVDKERRTERLEGALIDAANMISRKIEGGIGKLIGVIENKFNTLTLSVLYSAKVITDKLSILEGQNEEMKTELKKIANVSSAQEALMGKISVSSERLVEDLDYMREVVEYNDDRQFK